MAQDPTPTPDSQESQESQESPGSTPDAVSGDDVQNLVDEAMNDAQSSLEEIKDEVDNASVATDDAGDSGGAGGAGGAAAVSQDLAEMGLDQQMDSDAGMAANNPTQGKIQLLNDVDLDVMIELGRTDMLVEDVLRLGEGSVVELDKLAGDPVDVYVNNQLIARGEVLVLNDNFCIRISEIIEDLEEQAQAALQTQQASE